MHLTRAKLSEEPQDASIDNEPTVATTSISAVTGSVPGMACRTTPTTIPPQQQDQPRPLKTAARSL